MAHGQEIHQVMADQHREEMVPQGGCKYTPHDRLPPVSRSKGHGEELRLVPHFGKDHKDKGC